MRHLSPLSPLSRIPNPRIKFSRITKLSRTTSFLLQFFNPPSKSHSLSPVLFFLSTMSTTKKIILQSADNQEFRVNEAIAMKFNAVKVFFSENPDASVDASVPLPNVSSKCLSNIIEYCEFHDRHSSSSVNDEAKASNEKFVKAYDEKFVKVQDNESLREMMVAANYLIIKDLLDMLIEAVADRIKNKNVKSVRRYLGIENDYCAEEEAEYRVQNEWAFEGLDPDDD